ncbi:MAG: zinc-ribbon domain-containing protein [Promethearchaeota archaeon]
MNIKTFEGRIMFCQNCGVKLESENQRFCQNCGSEIIKEPEPPQPTYRVQQPTYGVQQPTTPTTRIPVPQYPSKFQKGSEPGKHSKISLAFGIISLIIALVTLQIGYGLPIYYLYGIRIGLSVARVIGIIFGIVSIVNSNTASGFEPETGVLKAGKGLGIAGLVLNSIFLIIGLTLIY